MLDFAERLDAPETETRPALAEIARLDEELQDRYKNQFSIRPLLTRQIVSFQANKTRPTFRWYKFKEGFSASLVEYLLGQYEITSGTLLDPFAGSGTALFTASALGLDTEGIELLPIGQQIVATRLTLERECTAADLERLRYWSETTPWKSAPRTYTLPTLRITNGAYSSETAAAIERYMTALEDEDAKIQRVLRFALLCVLEAISFTRKDGQYLRWDHRSGRRQGANPFDKGEIADFDPAISLKLNEILDDVRSNRDSFGLFPMTDRQGNVCLFHGSCLDLLPTLPSHSYEVVITSPPYCNRYDYTRTYALELALLGVSESALVELRQTMLSCTVENRAKDLTLKHPKWTAALGLAKRHELLQTILQYLDDEKDQGRLNNAGIPRMVRGYFYEMACVVAECARVMKPNALLFMVNDNVRYAGASISVDLILSDLAQCLGFVVENILVLPGGKGNSSQQMGEHGRDPLRKCVYVWRKV